MRCGTSLVSVGSSYGASIVRLSRDDSELQFKILECLGGEKSRQTFRKRVRRPTTPTQRNLATEQNNPNLSESLRRERRNHRP